MTIKSSSSPSLGDVTAANLSTAAVTDESPPRRLRIPFACARGLALLLGAFTLLNVIGELRNPGFDANLWWIDVRFAMSPVNQALMVVTGVALCLFAIRPTFAPLGGWGLPFLLGSLIVIAARNAWRFHDLISIGQIHSRFPVALSLLVVFMLGFLFWAVTVRRRLTRMRFLDRTCFGCGFGLGALLFPLAQMCCFGMTDYRRPADIIVVLGCKVFSDGTPSMALADRVTTGVELYHAGFAPRLLFSGGPGPGAVHETEAMRNLAMELGVPDSAIELDREGLNTQATVRNLVDHEGQDRKPRILAVSNFYHLPRIKLCFRRAGWEVWTVPAVESARLYYQERYMLREVAALWWYYLNPN